MNQRLFKKSTIAFKDYLEWQLDNGDSLCEFQSRRDVLIRDVKITSDLFKNMMRAFKKEYRESVKECLFLKSYTTEIINLLNYMERCIYLTRTKSPIPLKHTKWDMEITRDIYEGMRDALKEMFCNICKLM
jgi:hypothetical protein